MFEIPNLSRISILKTARHPKKIINEMSYVFGNDMGAAINISSLWSAVPIQYSHGIIIPREVNNSAETGKQIAKLKMALTF